MTINDIQDDIIAEFSDFDDWMDKYQLLIDLGNEQQPLPASAKIEQNLIEGCQSRVWLTAELTPEGLIHYEAESLEGDVLRIYRKKVDDAWHFAIKRDGKVITYAYLLI